MITHIIAGNDAKSVFLLGGANIIFSSSFSAVCDPVPEKSCPEMMASDDSPSLTVSPSLAEILIIDHAWTLYISWWNCHASQYLLSNFKYMDGMTPRALSLVIFSISTELTSLLVNIIQ